MIDETKIMQYADGTLPEDEKDTVKKAIENDPQLQKLLKDYQATGEMLFNFCINSSSFQPSSFCRSFLFGPTVGS